MSAGVVDEILNSSKFDLSAGSVYADRYGDLCDIV